MGSRHVIPQEVLDPFGFLETHCIVHFFLT